MDLTAVEDIKKFRDAFEKDFREKSQEMLKSAFSSFFAEHPEVLALGWTQYTAYFNDGDPCTFGVHGLHVRYTDPELHIGRTDENGADDEAEEFDPECASLDSDFIDSWELEGKLKENVSKLESAFSAIDGVMQFVYGDHVQVIVTREKAYISEYDHE